MARGQNRAFDALRNFEKRALIHAVGLPEQATAQGTWSGIGLRLAGANLVSEISEIVEIMNVPSYTKVPRARPWMLGVSNVRGTLVPIVDLRNFLSGEKTVTNRYTRVLVVPQAGGPVGLMIDEVRGQRHFLADEESSDEHYNEHMIAPYLVREYNKGGDYWGAFRVQLLIDNPEFHQGAL